MCLPQEKNYVSQLFSTTVNIKVCDGFLKIKILRGVQKSNNLS